MTLQKSRFDMASALAGNATPEAVSPFDQQPIDSFQRPQTPSLLNLEKLANRMPQTQQPNRFLESALHAGTWGLIGRTPGPALDRWRDDHPWQNFFSQALGELPTFIGSAGLALKIPRFAKMITKANQIDNTFLRFGTREVILQAPQAVGRQALSLLPSEEGTFGRTLGRNVLETGFGFGLGGGLPAIRDALRAGPFGGRKRILGDVVPAATLLDNLKAVRAPLADLADELKFDLSGAFQHQYDVIKSARVAGQIPEHKQKRTDEVLDVLTELIYGEETQLTKGGASTVGRARQALKDESITTEEFAKQEAGAKRSLYVGKVLDDASPDGTQRGDFLNQLFLAASRKISGHKMFASDEFSQARAVWQAYAPDDWQSITQFPRALDVKDAAKFDEIVSGDMGVKLVQGDRFSDLWMTREVNTNQYVGVMRAQFGQEADDVVHFAFKTSHPEKWAEKSSALGMMHADLFKRSNKWYAPYPQHLNEAVTPTAMAWIKLASRIDPALAAVRTPDDISPFFRFINQQGGEKLQRFTDDLRESTGNLGDMLRVGIAPFNLEFGKSARATAIAQLVKEITQDANVRINNDLLGEPIRNVRGSLLRTLALGRERVGGVVPLIQKHAEDPVAWREFADAWVAALTPEEAAEAGMGQKTLDLLKTLNRRDNRLTSEMNATGMAFGGTDKFVPSSAHYGISRTWVGDWRVVLQDTDGVVRGYASGKSRRAAMQDAQETIEHVNKNMLQEGDAPLEKFDPNLREHRDQRVFTRETLREEAAEAQMARRMSEAERKLFKEMTGAEVDIKILSRMDGLQTAMARKIMKARQELQALNPKRFEERKGFFGFKGQREALTPREVVAALTAQSRDHYNVLSRDFLRDRTASDMLALSAENQQLFKQMNSRMRAAYGQGGEMIEKLSAWPNKVLRPYLGDRGAEKIVRNINEGVFFLTLGAGDVGFAVLNGLSPIQTNLPEIAFLQRATPQRLSELYSGVFVPTADGGIRPFSYLDPAKVMRQGFREFLNPGDDTRRIFLRLEAEGRLGPKFVEEVAQSDKALIRNIRQGLAGQQDQNWFDSFRQILQYPAVLSEEFARGWSGINAVQMGKAWGLEGENLFLFVKKFIERTNFGYTMMDRPRMLTGWMGSGWGLFKTWSFNYLANLTTFADVALKSGGRDLGKNLAPLMYAMGGTLAVGGAAGIPAYGVADSMARAFNDQGLMETIYDKLGGGDSTLMADTMMYGLPSLVGLSMQGRASVPGANIGRDLELMTGGVAWERGKAIGSALGAAGTAVGIGQNPVTDPAFIRAMMKGLAPRTMARAYQVGALRARGEGIISLNTGNRMMPAPNYIDSAALVLGINPLEVDKTYRTNEIAYNNRAEYREAVAKWGKAASDAWMGGDTRALARVARLATIRDGIPQDVLIQSMNTRINKQTSNLADREFRDIANRRIAETFGL